MHIILGIIALVTVSPLIKGEDGSELCAKYGKEHIMCLPTKGKYCDKLYKNAKTELSFTEEQKQKILDAHNELRRKFATGTDTTRYDKHQAGNMRELVWNDDLEMLAKRWAAQCIRGGTNRNYRHKLRWIPGYDTEEHGVGENYYAHTTKDEEMNDAIIDKALQDWQSGSRVSTEPGKVYNWHTATNPYAQLIWANTDQIGCGYTRWSNKRGPVWHVYNIICYYAGGFRNNPGIMYEAGPPCSKCLEETTCKDDLCAVSEEEDDDDEEEGDANENASERKLFGTAEVKEEDMINENSFKEETFEKIRIYE